MRRRTFTGFALVLGGLVSAALVPSPAIAAASANTVSVQACCTWTSGVTPSEMIALQILMAEWQLKMAAGYTIMVAVVDPVPGGYRARLEYH